MRFGTWRGVTLAIALASALVSGRSASANDPFHHTIPPVVEAVDVNTGGPYYAPPVPYGHYAKDGLLGKSFGTASGLFHGLGSKLHGAGGLGHGCGGKGCGNKGCGDCGGNGLFAGHGHGNGLGGGCGSDCGGLGCGGGKHFRFKNCGLCAGKGCGVCTSSVLPSTQSAPLMASGQASTQMGSVVSNGHGCGWKGCGLGFGHKHGQGGGPIWDDAGNGGCHHGADASCGNCAGLGNGFGHGNGNGNACGACGGRGCNLCAKAKGMLGKGKGLVYGLLHPHAGKIEYFVGPGGPVPITPGYVPYVITTRSPRDFLAFPPFTP